MKDCMQVSIVEFHKFNIKVYNKFKHFNKFLKKSDKFLYRIVLNPV